MSEWQPIETAPTDKSMFVGFDAKHGRVLMRRWYEGATLHAETWPIDPCGLIDPPEPHLWASLPDVPGSDPGIPVYNTTDATDEFVKPD